MRLPSSAAYIFIDEITAAEDWPRALKALADEGKLEKHCLWVTGSNAFSLKNSGERLPGRRGTELKLRDVELLPLSFAEFYALVATPKKWPLAQAFATFCRWGGYPMALSELLNRSHPSVDLLQELVDVVLGEASRRHRSPRLSAALAERLWISLSSTISYNSLAKALDSGSHPIIRQYVEILEACYAIIQVERFNPKTGAGVLRKEKKIYFLDPMVMTALMSWARHQSADVSTFDTIWNDPVKQGAYLEMLVASELRKYGKQIFYDLESGSEVDFRIQNFQGEETQFIEIKRSMPSLSEVSHLNRLKQCSLWVGDRETIKNADLTHKLPFSVEWIPEALLKLSR